MDAADWLKNKPNTVYLNSFIAVLDREAEKMRSVVLCRIGDGLEGPIPTRRADRPDAVTCILNDAKMSSLELAGMESFHRICDCIREGVALRRGG